MINRFVFDIINENKKEASVTLFSNEETPFGVTITAKNTNYEYSQVQNVKRKPLEIEIEINHK